MTMMMYPSAKLQWSCSKKDIDFCSRLAKYELHMMTLGFTLEVTTRLNGSICPF